MASSIVARRFSIGLLALSLGLAGCKTTTSETPASNVPLTTAERQMRADSKEFNDTVAGGAAVWGAGGFAACVTAQALRGKSAQNILVTGFLCAIAGAMIGAADGYFTAKKKENADNNVRTLNATAEDIRKDNENLRRMNASSKRVLADSNARLREIQADVRTKKMSVAEANEERAKIEENKKVMEKSLEVAKKSRDMYKEVASKQRAEGTNTAPLDAQIAQVERQIRDLESSINSLNSTLEVTRVG